MELPHIGKNCNDGTCNQLDFLPIECHLCKKVFCKNHFSIDAHNCPSKKDHDLEDVPSKFVEEGPKCHFLSCSKVQVTECPACCSKFCMDHRIESDHKCSNLDHNRRDGSLNKTKAHVQNILASKKPKADPKVIKNQKMAAKVQLMKLKMKAEGNKGIPAEQRIFLGLRTRKKQMEPVFVDKLWSLGKVIDVMADAIGLQNKNNVSEADKLRLFKNVDGSIIHSELSMTIEQLLAEEQIFNGDLVILDYCKNEELLSVTVDPKLYAK